MYIVWTYLIYLAISVAITVGVARTLHKNGHHFLVDRFNGNGPLADSVNHLLVVGFYLINAGFVALMLKSRVEPSSVRDVIELLSTRIGVVLVVLGIMHFFNLMVLSLLRIRKPAPQPEARAAKA